MTLHHGDCLDILPTIPDGSVDAIITDPPYGTTACKWDAVIPLEPMWEQLRRVIKPSGAIVLFGSEPFSSALRMSNIKEYKYDWVWDRKRVSGFLNSKRRPLVQHEIISVFYNKQCTYNPQFHNRKLPRDFNGKLMKEDTTKVYGKQREYVSTVNKNISYPRSIIEETAIIGNSKEKVKHPTQKPVALIEYLIRTYTNEGETVLDFTMGSGTTGVSAVNTGREFTGIELDEGYYNIAHERIANTPRPFL